VKKGIGIDIGGTKVSFGVLDENGELSYEYVAKSDTTNSQTMYDVVTTGIEKLMLDIGLTQTEVSFGIGVPGIVDSEKGIAIFQNNLPWKNFPIVDELKVSFPQVEMIKINNDVACAAMAEWGKQDLKSDESMVFLTVSTGIASPVVLSGNVVKGEGVAGEIGLLPVYAPYLDKIDRLELVASGTAIQKFGRQCYKNEEVTTKDVFDKYLLGDEQAVNIIRSVAHSLAHAIYSIGCLIDPTTVVLGGSVIMKNPFMPQLIQDELSKMTIPVQADFINRIKLSGYDNNAGLIGAALSIK